MPYDFTNLSQDTANLQRYVKRFILSPTHWDQYPNRVCLNWSTVRFGRDYIDQVPDNEVGVYSFVISPGIAAHPAMAYPMYVGMTREQSFRNRYQQYLREPDQRKPRVRIKMMIENWPDHLYFLYAPLTDLDLIKPIEDDLLSAILPPVNTDFPATIRPLITGVFGW